MPITTGQSLSFYEILGPLGKGGMGEVYRALDTRLEREVAIKVLPDELSGDDDRLRRFEREAKTLASLNHPNLAHIYGIDQVQDTCFIAMELVPGEDLATKVARGALALDEAIDVCRQIAEGLEVAHEAGVVHRDLKPANVRVTPEGVVKILDFGLAKPIGPKAHESGTSTAESDSFLITEEGLILGTPTYMSPEQARGKPVDRRTDIWAFGCVLYECLTGKRAFGGEAMADILGAIVGSEPDLGELPANTPPHVNSLLYRCLEKDPRSRLRDIGEARVQLGRGSQSSVPEPSAKKHGIVLALALAALGGGALVWSAASLGRSELRTPREAVMLTIPASTGLYTGASRPRISPDGTSVLFSAEGREDRTRRLWLRPLSSFDARAIPGTEGSSAPFWSPDGASVGFFDAEGLKTVRLDDGTVRTVVAGTHRAASWSSRGVIVFSEPEDGLWTVPARGGEAERLTRIDREYDETGHFEPCFLPDGDRFLFLATVRGPKLGRIEHRLYTGALSSGETTFHSIIPSMPFHTERGELVYVDDGTVRSVPFDAEALRITGDARVVADGVYFFKAAGWSSLSVARDGTLAFQGQEQGDELWWLDRRGLELDRVGEPGRYAWSHRISPDGRSLALGVTDPRTELTDIWIRGLVRETATRVTSGTFWEGLPVWAPDGRSLYYATDERGWPDIDAITLDPPGEPRPIWSPERAQFPLDVTRNGRVLLAASRDEIWLVPLDENAEPERVVSGVQLDPWGGVRFSPDDSWIAYSSSVSGTLQVYIIEREAPHRAVQVSVEGGNSPVWDPRGDKLYYVAERNQLWEVDLMTEEQLAEPEPHILFQTGRAFTNFDVAPDGERFLVRHTQRDRPPISVVLRGDE